jgi:hypothetical protein
VKEPHSGRVLAWRQLQFTRPLETELVTGLLRQWAADQRSPQVVLESRADASGVRYLVAVPAGVSLATAAAMRALIPGLSFMTGAERRPVRAAAQLRASTRHRALRHADPLAVVRAATAKN